MMSLSIQEPKIERFFKHSQEEMIKALRFIVEHEIDYSEVQSELSPEQKKELASRAESYHNDRSIGKSWGDIKSSLLQ